MKTKPWIMAVLLTAAVLANGCTTPNEAPPASLGDLSYMVLMPSGLRFKIVVPSNGRIALAGDTVLVNYLGTLVDGKVFDGTQGRGPFRFQLGAGRVIKGWDEGVAGMRIGETRKLIIPPSLGYGAANLPNIPPNSTLIFQVQLIGIL